MTSATSAALVQGDHRAVTLANRERDRWADWDNRVMLNVTEYDPAGLTQRAGAWLGSEPVWHNVICTVLDRARHDPGRFADARWFLVAEGGDDPSGVAILTPPYPLGLTLMPSAAVDALAGALAERHVRPPGVVAESVAADWFATRWRELTAAAVEPGMEQWLYALDAVEPVGDAPGALRTASHDDRALLRNWFVEFAAETGLTADASDAVVDRWLTTGGLHVWDDGGAVCLAGLSRPVAGVVRIGPVYSPPEARRRGYATTCVAQLSRQALDGGATTCMLYADRANPASNSIYRQIGFRPVGQSCEYRFSYG